MFFQEISASLPSPSALIWLQPSVPSFDEIRPKTFQNFKKIPCAWQICVCEAVSRGDRDIISVAGTGMGKALAFRVGRHKSANALCFYWNTPLPLAYFNIIIQCTGLFRGHDVVHRSRLC